MNISFIQNGDRLAFEKGMAVYLAQAVLELEAVQKEGASIGTEEQKTESESSSLLPCVNR